jgi:hypothetical protein
MMRFVWFAVAWSCGIAAFLLARFELGARRNDIGTLVEAALALNPFFVIAAFTLMPAMLWANGRISTYRPVLLPLAGAAFSLVPIGLFLFSGPATASLLARAPEMFTRPLPLLTAGGGLGLAALIGTAAVVFGIALSLVLPTPPQDRPVRGFKWPGDNRNIADGFSVKQRVLFLAAAIVVPFVVQMMLLILAGQAEERWNLPVWLLDNVDYAAVALSVLSGVFLIRCGWRAYVTPLAVVYVPVMCYVLFR